MAASLPLFGRLPAIGTARNGGGQAAEQRIEELIDALLAQDYRNIPPSLGGRVGARLVELGKALEAAARASADQIVETSIRTSQAAGHVATLSVPANELNVSAQSMAAAVEELAASIADIHRFSERIASEAGDMRQAVDTSSESARESIRQFGELATMVREAMAEVQALGEASSEIGGIVETIEAIASRTQLLSLNATIEAARAGESGRSFAVVANEVRTLAQQTAEATEDIRARIEALVTRVSQITQTMGRGESIAEAGQEAIGQLGQQVEEVGVKAAGVTENIGQVSEILSQQTAAVQEMGEGIGKVARMAALNLEAVTGLVEVTKALEQSAARGLSRIAATEFPGKILRLAMADHALWMRRLVGVVHGELKLREDELASHHSCRLGEWYYGGDSGPYRELAAFRALEDPHRRVHELGKEIVVLVNEGRMEEALERIDAVREASEEVIRLLRELAREAGE